MFVGVERAGVKRECNSQALTSLVLLLFQETYYNLGRSMQQLGLFPAAVHYYKKTLATKPIFKNDKIFDLSQEAAFNLSLINGPKRIKL